MDLNTIAAIVAAVGAIAAAAAAFVALIPAGRAARAAAEQTKVQRELMQQAAQPYVWIDIQPDLQQGSSAQLVLGNSGPTVATNIRAGITPAISPDPAFPAQTQTAQESLAAGIRSLAPGRVIRWSLGPMPTLIERTGDTVLHFSLNADGPYGPLDPVEIDIRPNDWAQARDSPDGSLHHLRQEVRSLKAPLDKIANQRQREIN